jgi:hypothetical protein
MQMLFVPTHTSLLPVPVCEHALVQTRHKSDSSICCDLCANGRLVPLQSELHATKDELKATKIKLKWSDEELKASYKELQSTRDTLTMTQDQMATLQTELKATKEELQEAHVQMSALLAFQARLHDIGQSQRGIREALDGRLLQLEQARTDIACLRSTCASLYTTADAREGQDLKGAKCACWVMEGRDGGCMDMYICTCRDKQKREKGVALGTGVLQPGAGIVGADTRQNGHVNQSAEAGSHASCAALDKQGSAADPDHARGASRRGQSAHMGGCGSEQDALQDTSGADCHSVAGAPTCKSEEEGANNVMRGGRSESRVQSSSGQAIDLGRSNASGRYSQESRSLDSYGKCVTELGAEVAAENSAEGESASGSEGESAGAQRRPGRQTTGADAAQEDGHGIVVCGSVLHSLKRHAADAAHVAQGEECDAHACTAESSIIVATDQESCIGEAAAHAQEHRDEGFLTSSGRFNADYYYYYSPKSVYTSEFSTPETQRRQPESARGGGRAGRYLGSEAEQQQAWPQCPEAMHSVGMSGAEAGRLETECQRGPWLECPQVPVDSHTSANVHSHSTCAYGDCAGPYRSGDASCASGLSASMYDTYVYTGMLGSLCQGDEKLESIARGMHTGMHVRIGNDGSSRRESDMQRCFTEDTSKHAGRRHLVYQESGYAGAQEEHSCHANGNPCMDTFTHVVAGTRGMDGVSLTEDEYDLNGHIHDGYDTDMYGSRASHVQPLHALQSEDEADGNRHCSENERLCAFQAGSQVAKMYGQHSCSRSDASREKRGTVVAASVTMVRHWIAHVCNQFVILKNSDDGAGGTHTLSSVIKAALANATGNRPASAVGMTDMHAMHSTDACMPYSSPVTILSLAQSWCNACATAFESLVAPWWDASLAEHRADSNGDSVPSGWCLRLSSIAADIVEQYSRERLVATQRCLTDSNASLAANMRMLTASYAKMKFPSAGNGKVRPVLPRLLLKPKRLLKQG